MNGKLRAWRESGKHLPPIMRDFHDQKELFKTIHAVTGIEGAERNRGVGFSWVAAHIYVLDAFLWFMARHGYTLQKSRARLEFDDLGATIEARRELETKAFKEMMEARRAK